MSSLIKTGLSLLFLGCFFLAGMFVQRGLFERDTVQQRDTVYLWKEAQTDDIPPPAEIIPAPDSVSPVIIPKSSLRPAEDSSAVEIVPETRVWRDTLPNGAAYDIRVSGVEPMLEHVGIIWPERQVTHTEVRNAVQPGWALSAVGSVTAGGFRPEDILPFAGLELSYTRQTFSFGITPGIQWERPPGAEARTPSFQIRGTLKLQICRF